MCRTFSNTRNRMTIKFGTSMAYTESIFDCAASVLNLHPKNQFNESNQNTNSKYIT